MLPSASSFDQLCVRDTVDKAKTSGKLKTSSSFDQLCRMAAHSVRKHKLHYYFEVPQCMRRPFILTSYRNDHDFVGCLKSLLKLHNESVNVWSHLAGIVIFLALMHHVASAALPPGTTPVERWPLYVFILSAVGCLTASTAFHLIGTANARWYDHLVTWDYVGIVGLIVGSAIPVAWYSFGGEHHLERSLYLGAIVTLGALTMLLSLTGGLGRLSSGARIALFVGLALSGVLALLHAAWVHDFEQRSVHLIIGVAKMGLTYFIGIGFYATRFPEALQRGSFDNFGASHQLWHACVLLAAIFHFRTVHTLWLETAALGAGHPQLPWHAVEASGVATSPLASEL